MGTTGNIRVSGGIINDQMLTGSQRYFKLAGVDFSGTISDGTVEIELDYGQGNSGGASKVTIGEGHPVPNSAAEYALREVQLKATIAVVGVDSGVHFALENTGMGWDEVTLSPQYQVTKEAAVAMQEAIQALGTVTTPTGDVDLSGATVTEVEFKLA